MPKMPATRETIELTSEDVGRVHGIVSDEPPLDDIPDPVLPMSLIADEMQAQLNGAVNPNTLHGQALLEINQALFAFSQHAATVLANIDKSWDAALRVLNHNNAATLALKEALQAYAPAVPFSGTISAVTPSGYPLSLTVQHVGKEGFLDALGGILHFLKEQGFTPLTLPQLV